MKTEDQHITMPEKAGKAIGKAIGKVDGAILKGAVAMGKGVVAMVGAAGEEVKKALYKEDK